MKYGAYLKRNLREEWKAYYINYKKLKEMIKALAVVENRVVDVPTGSSGQGERVLSLTMNPTLDIKAKFNGVDITESDFFKALEEEMEKIDNFTHTEMTKLKTKVDEILAEVFDSNKEFTKKEKDEFIARAKQLGTEFLLLEKYVNMNYLGFHKILKKHDKILPIPCQRFYTTRLHSQKWIKHDYSKVFVELSKIHAKLRGDKTAKNENLGGQSFVRSTTKYWVSTQNISRVKHLILQNLPVFQHKLDDLTGDSQLTNSVYFDNTQMELYHGRLDKLPNAIAVRLRWYETEEPKLVFVERKTHFDAWTGDESVKERFTLQPEQVLPFLKGEFTVQDKINEMKAAKKSDKDIENVKRLFTEIYNQIDSKQLRPTLRTQYMRVAYQIPFDATVRISLDTNLLMITENPEIGPDCLTSGRWYRDPNLPLPPTEFTIFPHAILEVKLSLEKNEEAPEWVKSLVEGGLVTRVHKFSKYIHGCACLLSKSVQAVPYWVDDASIRPSMIRALPKDNKRSVKFTPINPKDHLLQFGERETFNLMNRKESMYGSLSDNDFDNDLQKEGRNSIHELSSFQQQQTEAQSESAFHDPKENDPLLGKPKSRKKPRSLLKSLRKFVGFKERDVDYYDVQDYNSRNKSSFKIRKTPMRIEPKVFFANERTFLSWIHMSITLGSISAILLSFAAKADDERNDYAGDVIKVPEKKGTKMTQLVGMILLPVSILFISYALIVFYWRAKHIKNRVDNDMFHDPIGPLALGTVLMLALSSIFILFAFDGGSLKF